jgi:hypothetical protein
MTMKSTAILLLSSALLFAAPSSLAQAPPAPTLVNALSSFYYVPDIYLSWRGASNSIGAVTYRIYRSLGDSSHFELVGSTYYSGYADFQILGGQVYYYYVTANVFRDTTRYESEQSSLVRAIAVSQGGGGGGSKRKNNGTIAGRVIDSLSGKAIPVVQVMFYRVSSPGVPVQKLLTDGSGHYRAALDTGTYVIKAQPPLSGGSPTYRSAWYRDALDPSHAEHIHVDDSSRIVADFDLVKPGDTSSVAVRGTVMDSAGLPLKGARVAILRSIQDMEQQSSSEEDVPGVGEENLEIVGVGRAQGVAWEGVVDSLGQFRATVPAGRSYVALAVKPGYAPEFFNRQSNPLMANILRLVGDTSGIDFDLNAISPTALYNLMGTVRDSNGVRVPSRVALIPIRQQFNDLPPLFTFTDSLGAFTVAHVRAGRYIALALPFSLYGPAYYRAGDFGTMRWQKGDTLDVAGDVSGIDIGVARITVGGINQVKGTITSGGLPAHGVNVFAEYSNGSIAGYGLTDDRGFYSVNGLPSERISLSGDLEGFQTAQTTVSVVPGDLTMSGVDLALVPASVTSVPGAEGNARDFALEQNFPNPFNPSTTITYALPVISSVSLKIYNIMGQEVTDLFEGIVKPGRYREVWNGKDRTGLQVASGVYFTKFNATPVSGGGNFKSMKKMLLLK